MKQNAKRVPFAETSASELHYHALSPATSAWSHIMTTTSSPTRQKWEGRWDQLVGKAKQTWGSITDDDVMKAKGDYEELLGQIKTRTGQTREEIEKVLDE